MATLGTATGNKVFGSVLISLALLTPPNKQTNKYQFATALRLKIGHHDAHPAINVTFVISVIR
jgi:hypothetical protein